MDLNVKFDLPFPWCTMCGAFDPTFCESFIVNEKTLPRCTNDGTCKAMAAAHDRYFDLKEEEQKNGNN